jgi:hypothetical protein
MPQWLQWVIGILFPVMIAHAVWANVTILQLKQEVFGVTGTDGLRKRVPELGTKIHQHDTELTALQLEVELLRDRPEPKRRTR